MTIIYQHNPQHLLDIKGQLDFGKIKPVNNEFDKNNELFLFWSQEIPWSCDNIILLELLDLKNEINIIEVFRENNFRNNKGWFFEYNNKQIFLCDLFNLTQQNQPVIILPPILFDKTKKKIVEIDSIIIKKHLLSLTVKGLPQLVPISKNDNLWKDIEWVKNNIIIPLYTMLFTNDIQQYKNSYKTFNHSIEFFENILKTNRFYYGDHVTIIDIVIFSVLIRFDVFFSRYLNPFPFRVFDLDNLSSYLRDLYQIPAFHLNTDFTKFSANWDVDLQKDDYWVSSFYDMVVPNTDWDTIWKLPSNREKLSANPSVKFLLTES